MEDFVGEQSFTAHMPEGEDARVLFIGITCTISIPSASSAPELCEYAFYCTL